MARHMVLQLVLSLTVMALSWGSTASPVAAETATQIIADQARQQPQDIDQLIGSAVARHLVSGAVVMIGSEKEVLWEKAYGNAVPGPAMVPLKTDAIFDIASLTKVVATAPAVMKLVEEKRVSLLDPVSRWFPELKGRDKEHLLVMHLLTHTSGLHDGRLKKRESIKTQLRLAARQKVRGTIGKNFDYADLNFIILGELVRRVTGIPLDLYCAKRIYGPLRMADTSFRPHPTDRFAATIGANSLLRGQVQDPMAAKLGGVAGNAGVFSTAADLARYCRMLLAGGEVGERRFFSERTLAQMTAPYFSSNGAVIRGLGWDINSPFSAPRAEGFSLRSFGHTGYSGSSVWIDPDTGLYVILLTVRLDYRNVHEFNTVRGQLSNLALQLYSSQKAKAAPAASAANDKRSVQVTAEVDKIKKLPPMVAWLEERFIIISKAVHYGHTTEDL